MVESEAFPERPLVNDLFADGAVADGHLGSLMRRLRGVVGCGGAGGGVAVVWEVVAPA